MNESLCSLALNMLCHNQTPDAENPAMSTVKEISPPVIRE